MEMSKLTRDGTAGPDSRDQTLRRERGQRIINFPCSAADHEQDWQHCTVVRAIHTNIVVLHSVNIPLFVLHVHIIQQQQKVNRARTNVCVCVFSSLPFWTSSSLDVPAGVTQEEGRTGFSIHLLSAVRALIFLARKIQPFLSLVDCEVEVCVLTI